MSLVPFQELPGESRLWIFGADRPPDAREAAHLVDRTRLFLSDWAAHGRDLPAGFDWRNHRFLLVAVDDRAHGPSGCSIDALVRQLSSVEEETGLGLVDTSGVWYRDPRRGGSVTAVSREEFRERARRGEVGPETVVFDLTVDRLADLRAGRWELPARETWHASLLPEAVRGGESG